jgi:UDP-glucose 4-epimerase
MIVCVTGVAGFIGSHLAERLIKDGHTVIGIDNLIGGNVGNIPEGVESYVLDCANLAMMTKVFKRHSIELVYHCAASPHEGLSVFSPVIVNQNTYMSTVSVATAAIASGHLKRFVFCSSMSRYGLGSQLPFNETWTPIAPVDPYGIAKVSSEKFLYCMADAHGFELIIAVPHNVYGTRQRYYDPYRNVASIMINRMLQVKPPIIYGDGEQKRCFSHIDDCIEPLIKMGFEDGMNGQIFNIGPDHNPITINQLASLLAELLDFGEPPIYYPDRPCEVKEAWPSSDKARKLLGYESKVSLRDGMQNLIDWIITKGPRPFEYTLPIEIQSDKTPETWVKKVF